MREEASRLRDLLANRLVQFIAIGGLIFAIAPASERRDTISVERQTLQELAAASTLNSGNRGPTPSIAQEREIEERYVEDEILYREGLRLGFDKDDGIVRQRLVQKVLFLAEELGGASRPPTDEELLAFYQANAGQFLRPARIRFRHIFARQTASLPAAPHGDSPAEGELSPIGPGMDAELPQIERALGSSFATAINALEPGVWSSPIESPYGWHLVRVVTRAEARPATFEEARADVIEQFLVYRRQEAIATYLSRTFPKYRVEIDGQRMESFTPSRRLALRGVPSAED